jgi:hypothetical protein
MLLQNIGGFGSPVFRQVKNPSNIMKMINRDSSLNVLFLIIVFCLFRYCALKADSYQAK